MAELVANLIRYAPGERMSPHSDGCRRLSVVVSGSVTESDFEHVERASTGSVALKAPGFVHHNRFGDRGAVVVSALLPDAALERLGHRASALSDWRWNHADDARLQGLRLAAALRLDDADAVATVLRLFLESFERSAPTTRRPPLPNTIRRIQGALRADPLADIPVTELARRERVHPVSLCRTFRRHVGCSITRYRQRQRIGSAARALVAGQALVEVAIDHGFSDLSHLTRVFRRELGVPPGRFRAALATTRRLDSFKTEWTLTL